jgi:hypothetical protein
MSVRRLISLFSHSSGLVDQIFFQWLTGKPVKASRSSAASRASPRPGGLAAEHAGDDVEPGAHVLGVGLGEDRADGGGDHLAVALGHAGEHVAHEVGL